MNEELDLIEKSMADMMGIPVFRHSKFSSWRLEHPGGKDWHPTHPKRGHSQAWECADKSGFMIAVSKTPLGWSIFLNKNVIVVDSWREIPEALCRAIYLAMEGEKDG